MKKIFLLIIANCFIACVGGDDDMILCGPCSSYHPPIQNLQLRLVDTQGNWIEVNEEEMQVFVADSQWNILDPQPENYLDNTSHYLWSVEKFYNPVVNPEKELLSLLVFSRFKELARKVNDETYGDYIVLQIDENRTLNIQLFYKDYPNMGISIEKFVCNGIEYINLEYTNPDDPSKDRALVQKTNDIIIE